MSVIKRIFKRHIGVIILLVLLLVFPSSVSNQAKLNMRIIVTGIAIDKVDDEYEVTAQVVKNTPGTESPGTSATIELVSDKASTVSLAMSNLSYKAGKVAAFSHTSFVILGKSVYESEGVKCLDYFIRDKIIKASTMLLFAEDKASDEIKKTKDIELSVGLGLQKVFLYKERESDGLMVTILDFLKESESFSQTSVASTIVLTTNEEDESQMQNTGSGSSMQSGSSSGSSGQTSLSQDNPSGSGESSGSGGGSSGSGSGGEKSSESGSGSGSSSSSSSESSGGSSSGEGASEYFKAQSPIMCFVDGKFACKLETTDEFVGFMLVYDKSKNCDISLEDEKSKASINIKNKSSKLNLRYENGVPCLDIVIYIKNAEINEILTDKIVNDVNYEEYSRIERAIKAEVANLVSTCFEKAKSAGADIFHAYELGIKYHYGETMSNFDSYQDFVDKLRINVDTKIIKLDY